MKLYTRPGACSLTVHILLHEVGARFDVMEVDLATKRTADGADYLQLNPRGQVPALVLDDGALLTEVSAIAHYLSDHHAASALFPDADDPARYRALEWLSFLAAELHKSLTPLMRPGTPEEAKAAARTLASRKLDVVEGELDGRAFLAGDRFTPADAYLFVLASWLELAGLDRACWPRLAAFRAQLATRPSIRAALEAEGLS